MPKFTFEQEVFSLVKLKANTLINNNLSDLRYLHWREEIENEMLKLLVEVEKLRAQCSESSTR